MVVAATVVSDADVVEGEASVVVAVVAVVFAVVAVVFAEVVVTSLVAAVVVAAVVEFGSLIFMSLSQETSKSKLIRSINAKASNKNLFIKISLKQFFIQVYSLIITYFFEKIKRFFIFEFLSGRESRGY